MTPRRRLLFARVPASARAIWIAAPAAAAATLVFYFLRAARRRRSESIPVAQRVPLLQCEPIHDDPVFWEQFDAPSGAEEQVSHTPGPLIQLEAVLAEKKKDEGTVIERSRVPAPVEFVRQLITLPAPEIDATHRSFYFLRPATWRLPILFASSRITQGKWTAGLAGSSRLLGRHRILNGLALFLTGTLVAYVLAGGMHRANNEPAAVRQPAPSVNGTMSGQYAVGSNRSIDLPQEPLPPAEGPGTAIAPRPLEKAQPSPTSKNHRRVAQIRRSRHRVTSFDKARAFFRRLF
jgi:hypothetical protein